MAKEDFRIEIRPIPNRGGIRSFSENLEYFNRPHVIAPFVNPTTMKYEVGLDEEDIKYLKKQGCPYEIEDTLYTKGEAHKFWESDLVKMELKNTPDFLFPYRSILDYIKWKYLSVNSYIYNSEAEMKLGSKPQATHYIFDEVESVKIKATATETKNALIMQLFNLSLGKKKQILEILENEDFSTKAEEFVTVKLSEILESKNRREELSLLLENSAESLEMKALVKSAIRKNVLKKTKKGIFYFDTNLGFAEADVIDALSKTDNQELYLTIKNKIKG